MLKFHVLDELFCENG